MTTKRVIKNALALSTALAALPGQAATTVEYELQALGGSQYRYTYTVTNDGSLPGASAIQLFDILFDPTLYDETTLTIAGNPALAADWTQQFLGSAPGIPAAFDVSANGAGIIAGSNIGGFAVDFVWLGAGLPNVQNFEVYDPSTFDLLESGTTSALTAVPVPGALALFFGGISLISGISYRRKATA